MSRNLCTLLLAVAASYMVAQAQSAASLPDAPTPAPHAVTLRNFAQNFGRDQAAIWTSPFRLSEGQAAAGLFFVAATGAIGSEDRDFMRHHFLDHTTNDHANTASTGLTGILVATPVAFYGFGLLHHDAHAQQTGLIASEAMVDSLAVNQVFKIASRRERPTLDDARGKLFQSGVGFDSSFASNHATVAWSSATVIASRSNSKWVKLSAYGLATGVSATRIVGRDHFPSDVFAGSAVGWMIGHYVNRHHSHDIL
jgi:hypothetical protein